jgi:uncharacterized membrane protein
MDIPPTNAAPPAEPPSAPPPPSGEPSVVKTSLGLEPNIAAGLAVLFQWLGGLIFYLVEKDSVFVRFYALQSILLSVTYIAACILSAILSFMAQVARIPFTLQLGSGVFGILFFVFWIITLVNAFGGKVYKIPGLGNFAAKQTGLPDAV